jgi:hypothetical protein
MATSRRNFLKTGTMGLICVGVPAALAKVVVGNPTSVGAFSEWNAKSLINFTRETFATHLNTTFRIRTSSAVVDLKLANVTDLKSIPKIGARIAGKESFSLLFVRSSNAACLTQDTYILEHAALGRFSLFLVPVGKSANRHHEAIIIRL